MIQSNLTPDFENLFDNMKPAGAILDHEFNIRWCNQAYATLVGTPKALACAPFQDVVASKLNSQDYRTVRKSLERAFESAETVHIQLADYKNPSQTDPNARGELLFIINTPVTDKNGAAEYLLHQVFNINQLINSQIDTAADTLQNIQARDNVELMQMLVNERQRISQLFQQAPGFVAILNGKDHIFEMVNDAYLDLVGRKDVVGKSVAGALPEVVSQGFIDKLDRVYQTGEPFIGRAVPIQMYRNDRVTPEDMYIDLLYQPITAPDGSVSGIFVQGHDVTEAHELAQKVSYQASHDPLTNLFNRRVLSQQGKSLERATGIHSLLYMDLDHFKIVNDRCGHYAGDALLIKVARELKDAAEDGLLARLGGDEFVLVLEHTEVTEASRVAAQIVEKIRDLLFVWEGNRYSVTISIGIAEFGSENKLSYAHALSLADSACFLAKDKGRDRVQISDPKDVDIIKQHQDMDWTNRLKDAIREDRIVLYGQEIVSLGSDDRLQKKEILSRLEDKDGTIVPPGAFITAAERFGLIELLDRHIIAKAVQELCNRQQSGADPLQLFINVSGITLSNPDFLSFMHHLLESYPEVSPEYICLEVTETAAVADLGTTGKMMADLNEYGIRFALDDFGSGVATFSYLEKLPVKYVKIDGEFVSGIQTRPIGEAIVKSIHEIASVMNVQTIAECIEDKAIIKKLTGIGIDYGQGYAIHKPEPL